MRLSKVGIFTLEGLFTNLSEIHLSYLIAELIYIVCSLLIGLRVIRFSGILDENMTEICSSPNLRKLTLSNCTKLRKVVIVSDTLRAVIITR